MSLPLPDDLKVLVGGMVHDGAYHNLEYCDSGKRGHVFRASRTLGGQRALKFVSLEKLRPGWDQEAVKAHLLEDQPNTVRFFESFFHKEYAVLVFDFVEGMTLRERITRRVLSVADVQRILYELLYFHRNCLEKGVRHGDLHPGNIIIRNPPMGRPREYEVKITDFGIGYTGAVLSPKDDLTQIGQMTTLMLQSITREHLGESERATYDELCHGSALKSLREASPLEKGDQVALVQALIDELDRLRSRVSAAEPSGQERAHFGDYLQGEQLGNRWPEWKSLFVAGFPGYEDIVSRNITVLTGTRGCGKTMVFRRLSALLSFQVGPVDAGAAGSLVGFYLNMNDIADAFLLASKKLRRENFAKRVIQFFHICLLSEIVRVAAVAQEKAPPEQKEAYDNANHWLFELVSRQVAPEALFPGAGLAMPLACSLLERAKDEVRESKRPPAQMAALAVNDWLKRFVPDLQQRMPWIGGRPIYFFLDDYSLPRVSEPLQRVLNSVVFQRVDSFFFKIATESPSTLCRIDYSGKMLDDPHDFGLTDLGSVTIDLPDSEREAFLEAVFRPRFNREERLEGFSLRDVFGVFDKSWTDLARDIVGQSSAQTAGAGVDSEAAGRVLYHGREVFVNMWSGDTRSMLRIVLSILEQLPVDEMPKIPIRPETQDKVFRGTGGEFLHLLEACTRTAQHITPLPGHISSWGKHLVKVAEAFKDIALHEMRTRTGGRKGRNEPKQAFRIEPVDEFSLDGIEKEIYDDLIRYGVFLRDDRGKSIRGAIIPRLYLRRLLIPYCTLTFSKVDNIALNSFALRQLLLHPKTFPQSWKRDRRPLTTRQEELF